MTEMNANDLIMSGGTPSAKFDNVGDFVTGRITAEPEVQQQRDLKTGEPKVWPDGKPMQQIRVVLSTDQRDQADPYDEGDRAVYIKGQMLKQTRAAIRASGARGLEVGGTLTVKYVADGEVTQRGFNPPKVYEVAYQPPPAGAAANAALMGGAPAPSAPQPAPAQQAAAPAAQQPQQQPAAAPAPAAGQSSEAAAAISALTPEQRAALGL